MPEFQMYPKWKYKEGESPRLVQTHVEEADLGDTWFDKPDGTDHAFDQAEAAMSATPPGYVPQEYPKWQYAREYPGGRVVHNLDEENALPGVSWFDKPDFTNNGENSTDTTSMVSTTGVSSTQPDALSGPNVLAPVPEMKQGVAKQKASNVSDMDIGAVNSDNAGSEDVNDGAGTEENNFDNANGENPGDAAPAGENPNGPTGKVTKPKKAGAKKDADDLL